MRLGTHRLRPIQPTTPPDRLAARNGRIAETAPIESDDEDAPIGTALIVTPRSGARQHPSRRAVSSHLATQLLAQKLPGKSERRLARFFPERVHLAYRRAATPIPSAPTQKRV